MSSRSTPRAAWKPTCSPTRRTATSARSWASGFAPQTGGAVSLIDQVGIKKFVAECDDLARKYGPQFEVPKLLRDMAAKGQGFYANYHPAKAA